MTLFSVNLKEVEVLLLLCLFCHCNFITTLLQWLMILKMLFLSSLSAIYVTIATTDAF